MRIFYFKQNIICHYKFFTYPIHKRIEVGLDIYPITFLIFWCEFIIRRRRRSSIVIILFLKWSCPYACRKIRISAYGYCFFPEFMNESSQTKNSEDNYENNGFWDANYLNFLQQKNFIGVQLEFWIFSRIASPIISYFSREIHLEGKICITVQCYHWHHTWYVTSWFFNFFFGYPWSRM